MPGPTQDERGQLLEPLLDYGCSNWKTSSQRAADLYDSGVKLWRKEDLVDIERQLAQSFTARKFTVRRIDGSVVHIKNPMFGVQKPIWKPYIKFQEFWNLVRTTPDGPPETYHCTYLVDWINQTVRNYEGPIENAELLFETSRKRWNASVTCEAFTSQFRALLSGDANVKKVTKIVCFGLGSMTLKPLDWWRIQNDSMPKDEQKSENSVVEAALIQHAIALTMVDVVRSRAEARGTGVKLLTQDPGYSNKTKDILQKMGFEVIGEYGAGGFAELDENSVVFSAFTKAPVKQIIADLARPAAIICNRSTSASVFNQFSKPIADPESPRTRQMWQEYKSLDFPVSSESVQVEGSLDQLVIYARIREQRINH